MNKRDKIVALVGWAILICGFALLVLWDKFTAAMHTGGFM